jgi:antibiotic biosynthesis monooxygenase (ABM) superfamily enzyme
MSKTRGTGLLMLWTDVDLEHEAEFNRWYNEEHIQHLLKVPGFLSAGRYAALSGGPQVPGDVRARGTERAADAGLPR